MNYEVIQGLRERALNVINQALHSTSPRMAVAAGDSLSHVLAEFHPRFRVGPTEEEQQWQDRERLFALDLLQRRIEVGNLPLALIWRLRKLFRRTVFRGARSAEVKAKAAALLASLPSPEFGDLFYVMCTDEYEDGEAQFESISISSWRRDLERTALAELGQHHPDTEGKIAEIEHLIQLAVDAGIEPGRLEIVLARLCLEPSFLNGFSDFLVRHQNSLLASQANFALYTWRNVDPSRYFEYGSIFAQSINLLMARSTAGAAVSYRPRPPKSHPPRPCATGVAGPEERRVCSSLCLGGIEATDARCGLRHCRSRRICQESISGLTLISLKRTVM